VSCEREVVEKKRGKKGKRPKEEEEVETDRRTDLPLEWVP